MRLAIVKDFVASHGRELTEFSAFACRGGLLQPVPSGTYCVNEAMIHDLQEPALGAHASNLAACIGFELSRESGIPSYIVDPVVVDELDDVARVSGNKLFKRNSISMR